MISRFHSKTLAFAVAASGFFLLFSGFQVTVADQPLTPLAYKIPIQPDGSNDPHTTYSNFGFRLGLADTFNKGMTYPDIFGHGFAGTNGQPQINDFNSYAGPVPARTYLPPCISETDSPCIESVSSRSSGESDWTVGSVSAVQPDPHYGQVCGWCSTSKTYAPFVSAPFSKDTQSGGLGSMWTLPKASHGGGSDYRVDVQLNQRIGTSTLSSCGFEPCTFMQIVPFKLGPSRSFDVPTGAVYTDYQVYEFPKDTEFRIVLRLAGADLIKPDGFFFGRVQNLSLSAGTDEYKRLTIIGQPVRVPIAEVWPVPILSIPSDLAADWGPYLTNPQLSCKTEIHIVNCIVPVLGQSAGVNMLAHFLDWEKRGLKTVAVATIWELTATVPPVTDQCASLWTGQSITGSVTTNASIYSATVPIWDSSSHSFVFTVGSTHLDENGSSNRGYYRLMISSGLVNCIWGSGASAANAEIQIVSENGISQVATTDVHEENGMFYFTAANFEYSNPNLRISFKTPLPSMPSALPTPAVSPSSRPTAIIQVHAKPRIKTTITCVKGKLLKKVVELKPICPNGYKKK